MAPIAELGQEALGLGGRQADRRRPLDGLGHDRHHASPRVSGLALSSTGAAAVAGGAGGVGVEATLSGSGTSTIRATDGQLRTWPRRHIA
jgi:hypothetical protein